MKAFVFPNQQLLPGGDVPEGNRKSARLLGKLLFNALFELSERRFGLGKGEEKQARKQRSQKGPTPGF
ncbi:hypothetical protein ACO2Q8_15590 [Larkinella sp. VNQ87]|uniref:hypothetical protein n=1 Tax=Larkinella sp. VNQ87 TaxID=3400921 RepID=UPI003C051EA6